MPSLYPMAVTELGGGTEDCGTIDLGGIDADAQQDGESSAGESLGPHRVAQDPRRD
jgi:hypothetical protein